MRQWRIVISAAVVAATVLSSHAAHAGNPGDAGALFLRMGMGARASGMGEAYTAVAQDASSVYWNPGAMAAVLGTNVVVMHNEYIQSVRLEQAAVTHETDYGTFAFSFTGMFMDDMERRENVPTAIPLGEFAVYDVAFAAGYSRYVIPNLSVGATVKPIVQKIDEYTAQGVAVDVGIFHVSRVKGVKFAAVAGNIGAPMKFEEEEYALPRYLKAGASYERELPELRGDVLLTFDAVFPNDDDMRQHVGAEFAYDRRFFLRAGYKANYDSQGATFGLGVFHRGFSVDYAFLLVRNDLGDSHRIGVAVRL